MKKKPQSLIVAAQNESIGTNLVETKIDKSQKGMLCRLYMKADENIGHVVSVCSKFAQKEYKRGHDNLDKTVTGNLLETATLKLKISSINMSQKVFQTDHVIQSQRVDVVVVDKERRT